MPNKFTYLVEPNIRQYRINPAGYPAQSQICLTDLVRGPVDGLLGGGGRMHGGHEALQDPVVIVDHLKHNLDFR